MIFVTVGTHEQQFNRLVKYMDELAGSGKLDEAVIIQTGYSNYIPKYAMYSKFYSYDEMQKYYKDARIIITHGGPSSFIPALQLGKVPIVVPRQKKYNEHINDHQVDFCKYLNERNFNIHVVNCIKDIYTYLSSSSTNYITDFKFNNAYFCTNFSNIIYNLLPKYFKR